ncbi:hypothetical protein [Streptomyces sp. NPDC050121]|uniref:hypothetical protein n=1 Tax=Streptomyces sp. NPDC050121 TaxID=3365601 RepID=UPI00379EF849
MNNPTNGGRQGRHRRRWTATGLVLGVPAVLVSYLLFAQEDSQESRAEDSPDTRVGRLAEGRLPFARSGSATRTAAGPT